MLLGISPKIRQVLTSCSGGMVLAGMMCTWGFPAAALPQMEQPDSGIHLTLQQASWFATVPLMMCIPGSLVGGVVYEWGGPRRMMLVLIPMVCASTMIMTVASWRTVQEAGVAEIILLTSRILQGAFVALFTQFVPVYTYESCDQDLRGTFTSLIEVWASLGFLLCYIAGCFLSWGTIAWLLPTITLVPAFIGIFLSAESPLWLARKGREEEARAVLTLVRCTKEEVMTDLKTVRNSLQDNDLTCSESVRKIAKKSNIMAIIASCLILIMKELGGFAVLSIYIVYIFNEAGVGMDPRWSSVIVGLARISCNGFASFLMHNLPRKLMLISGNILTGIATFSIGIFFYLQDIGQDVSSLSWLPLTGFVVHMISYAGAVGPATWTIAVEMLPGPVRSIGFGLGNATYAATAFIMSKTFMELKALMGLYGVFWFFSSSSVCWIVLLIFYIPETRGRTMQEIEDYWTNAKKVIDKQTTA